MMSRSPETRGRDNEEPGKSKGQSKRRRGPVESQWPHRTEDASED
jgi:hypothetical protein